MDIQEISDRMEIESIMIDYCHAIDDADWDALDSVFTSDATIDYTEMANFRGNLAEAKAWLPQAMSGLSKTQHIISTSQVRIEGDRAWARTVCTNPMVVRDTGDFFVVGLWYRDELRRTPDGWRIAHRYEENCWRFNVPEGQLADPEAARAAWIASGGTAAGPCAADKFPQPLR